MRKKMKNSVSPKTLVKLLKKHKKLKVQVWWKLKEGDYRLIRERMLFASGGCVMRYRDWDAGEDAKFGRYHRSCFVDQQEIRASKDKRAELVVKMMKDHDKYDDMVLGSIFAGKGFKRKVA